MSRWRIDTTMSPGDQWTSTRPLCHAPRKCGKKDYPEPILPVRFFRLWVDNAKLADGHEGLTNRVRCTYTDLATCMPITTRSQMIVRSIHFVAENLRHQSFWTKLYSLSVPNIIAVDGQFFKSLTKLLLVRKSIRHI